jgi:hypothetical protein
MNSLTKITKNLNNYVYINLKTDKYFNFTNNSSPIESSIIKNQLDNE